METNRILLAIRNDIQRQMVGSIAFQVFNKKKIDAFLKQNHIPLAVLDAKVLELVKRHVAHDENGQPKTADGKYLFEKPEDEKNYLNDYNELMDRNVTIHT